VKKPHENKPHEEHEKRSIRVEAMTRVEGEGGLEIEVREGRLEKVHLRIFEPPRFFEALLRGRPLEEVPDITARICGICPVAYQMSAVHALEKALGVTVPPELRRLRRLLYCGEWIESHVLHVHMLHLPDFLGFDGVLEMAKVRPEWVQRGLRLRKIGNELLERLGGRAIHPINVAVGGFYRAPRSDELVPLVADFEEGLQLAIESTRQIAQLDFPSFNQPYDWVALVHPEEYPFNEGRIETSDQLAIDPTEFEHHFAEIQVPHSTALHAIRTATGKPYLVGPLARINHARHLLRPTARRLADEIGLETPCTNPYRTILARSLEVVHAIEEGLEILKTYQPPRTSRIAYTPHESHGCAATEAPRGLLYHRYALDDVGKITAASIIPPTSQNQAQIEADLKALIPSLLGLPDEQLATRCEQLVRCYDPCISCSTHFLRVHIRHQ